MDAKELKIKMMQGFVWESFSKLLIQLFAWVSTFLVARILIPEDYGLVAVAGVFTGALILISDMGISSGLIQATRVNRSIMDTIFWLSIFLSLFLWLLIYIAAPYIENFYGTSGLADILRISGSVLLVSAIAVVPNANLMRDLNFRFRAISQLISQLVMSATALIMAYKGFGYWSLVWSVIIGRVALTLILLSKVDRLPRLHLNLLEAVPIYKFGFQKALSGILSFFRMRIDVMVIGKYFNTQQLGHYSMAFTMAAIPMDKIGTIFNSVLFPVLSKIKHDLPECGKIYLSLNKILTLISFPIFVGLIFVAEDLIILLLTEKWVPMVPIFQLFCILNLMRVSVMIMVPVLDSLGFPGIMVSFNIIAILLLSVSFYIGAKYGIRGVAFGWLVSFPFLYLGLLRVFLKKIELSLTVFLQSNLPAFLSSILMGLSLYCFTAFYEDLQILIRFSSTIFVGVISYFLSLALFFRSDLSQILTKMKSLVMGKSLN